jgi:hypothetical protein
MKTKTIIAIALAAVFVVGCSKKPAEESAPAAPAPEKAAPVAAPEPTPAKPAAAPAPEPAAPLPVAQAQDKQVPLKLELPKEKLAGTPVAVKAPNLQSLAETRAANRAVQVPAGSVNLALNKAVTSSDSAPIIGMLEQITDGDKQSDDGYFVELGDGKQWVQIDLEKKSAISAVALWHYHSQERAYADVIIQVSNDPDFIEGVVTVFNNDHDNSSGLGIGKDKAYIDSNNGRAIAVTPAQTARYVRLYSKGNTSNSANHYIEVEVWGK